MAIPLQLTKVLGGEERELRRLKGVCLRQVQLRLGEKGILDPALERELAEECIGEAYLALVEERPEDVTEEGKYGVNAVAKAATTRFCYSEVFRHTRKREEVDKGEVIPDPTPGPSVQTEGEELLAALRERIAKYPRRAYRKALALALAVLLGEEEGTRKKDNALKYERERLASRALNELAALVILQGQEVPVVYDPRGRGSKWRFRDLGIWCCSPVTILYNIMRGEG